MHSAARVLACEEAGAGSWGWTLGLPRMLARVFAVCPDPRARAHSRRVAHRAWVARGIYYILQALCYILYTFYIMIIYTIYYILYAAYYICYTLHTRSGRLAEHRRARAARASVSERLSSRRSALPSSSHDHPRCTKTPDFRGFAL